MKIIDAYWENRNIGVTTTEVVVESCDTLQHIVNRLRSIDSQYIVVKLPTCCVNISFELSKLGFTFVETMNHLEHNMNLAPLDKNKDEIYTFTQFLPMDNNDVDYVYSNIRNELFRTDRIYLDPFFNLNQSANRYIGWISDEIRRGSELYKLIYKGHYFGFVGFKKINDYEYQEYIYGIFPEYQKKGLAFNTVYKLVDTLKDRGARSIFVDVSSNNMASLHTKLRNGFLIKDFTYVFVRHN